VPPASRSSGAGGATFRSWARLLCHFVALAVTWTLAGVVASAHHDNKTGSERQHRRGDVQRPSCGLERSGLSVGGVVGDRLGDLRHLAILPAGTSRRTAIARLLRGDVALQGVRSPVDESGRFRSERVDARPEFCYFIAHAVAWTLAGAASAHKALLRSHWTVAYRGDHRRPHPVVVDGGVPLHRGDATERRGTVACLRPHSKLTAYRLC
jgi:hypothetical protein